MLTDSADPEKVKSQVRSALEDKLRQAGAAPPVLDFDIVEAIERDPRTMSKLKLVQSELARPQE